MTANALISICLNCYFKRRSERESILDSNCSPFSDAKSHEDVEYFGEFTFFFEYFSKPFQCRSLLVLIELSFPLSLERTRSMQSLRHRHDPYYHGIRSRRPRRVVSKTGERNVGFLHIPERSRRFIKDFVTTFVRLYRTFKILESTLHSVPFIVRLKSNGDT